MLHVQVSQPGKPQTLDIMLNSIQLGVCMCVYILYIPYTVWVVNFEGLNFCGLGG